jgi:YD repeat-containing protein
VSIANGSPIAPATSYSCTGTLPASGGTVPPRDVTLAYFEYDAIGNVTLERHGSAALTGMTSTKREYTATNFLVKETLDDTGLNRVTAYTNDVEGRRLTETTGTFVRSYGYDSLKRPETVSTANGTASPFTSTSYYDGWGRKIRERNPRGYDTDYTLDLADRVTKVQSPSTTVWSSDGTTSSTARPERSTGYNTFNQLTHAKDERANTTSTSYDTSGRMTTRTYPRQRAPVHRSTKQNYKLRIRHVEPAADSNRSRTCSRRNEAGDFVDRE